MLGGGVISEKLVILNFLDIAYVVKLIFCVVFWPPYYGNCARKSVDLVLLPGIYSILVLYYFGISLHHNSMLALNFCIWGFNGNYIYLILGLMK